MTTTGPILSSADARRRVVADAAVRTFAEGGYRSTTVSQVAAAARISPAYVFKLYPSKEAVFVAALEGCFDRIVETLEDAADAHDGASPQAVLDAMGDAYAALIADRTLLLLQVHAQSAADVSEIGAALRAGLARVVELAKTRSGASDDAVQRFIAYGQLCHLIVTTRIEDVAAPWARVLTHDMTHP